MSRRLWMIVNSSAIVGIFVFFYVALFWDPVLWIPSAPPGGCWGDPEEGARWEEEQRRIGVELSRRQERGPIRCSLRVRKGAAFRQGAELEVKLTNSSDKPVTIPVHRFLLDQVTFIFRDPDDNVVSSFCYVNVDSDLRSAPPVVLRPGESDNSPIFLSVATDHGYRTLRPGLYSLEAVFHETRLFDALGPDRSLLARSHRIPVRVGDLDKCR
jgi:hypothetical protein